MPGLAFREVYVRYEETIAVGGLDLEAIDGELTVIVGPSGCGKTTTLRVAAGLAAAESGEVWIGDRNVTDLTPVARNVGMVFQNFALFPHLSAGDNIRFGLAVRKVKRSEARQRALAAAEVVGCQDLLDRMPSELSGGEQQRVALARALVRDPSVFLLDEPLSNLDAQMRVAMRAEVKRIQRGTDTTMLYVTHDQVEALTIGDRIAVMHAGTLQQVGAPDDVYRQPSNRMVATFIGSPPMSILSAEVREGALHAGPLVLPLPDASLPDEVEVGVRPEHLEIGGSEGPGGPATVELVEPTGPETFVRLSGGLVVRVPPEVRPALGDRVSVRLVDPGSACLFNAKSGERVSSHGHP